MRLGICACQFYHRIPEQTLATVVAACHKSGLTCEVIPDLCFLAAKDRPALQAFNVILACQVRAVRALLGNDSNTTQCYDLQNTDLPELLAALSLEVPSDKPAPAEYVALPADWVPWFPVLDETRCVHCGKCVDFCLFGVYTQQDGKVKVAVPENCKTNCPACSRMCPQNAIIFPKSPENRLNGSLVDACPPKTAEKATLSELLQRRKAKLRLFKEEHG